MDMVIDFPAGKLGAATTIPGRNERSGSDIPLNQKNTAVQFGNALSD